MQLFDFCGVFFYGLKVALCTECHRNKTDFERTLKTVLENGGSQSVVFPDSWPHIIPNALYSKHITSPIVIYIS